MSYTPAEFLSPAGDLDNFASSSNRRLTSHIFEADLMQLPSPAVNKSPEFLVLDSPFNESSPEKVFALLAPELLPILENANVLEFSTPVDNFAAGQDPDFRLLQGLDGVLRLEPLSADPLADGKLNIEIDTNNKSLAEAIKQADANLKEHIRELIAYWVKTHPGRPYPGWWQDILDSTPFIPEGGKPVQIAPIPPGQRPAQSPLPQAPTAPSHGWQPDYRNGGGRGYGNGPSSDSSGKQSYYQTGGTTENSLSNDVPVLKDNNNFIDRLSKTIMKNEGALNSDGSPRFSAYNADDNGGISVGLRQWHAGGALPELLNAWKDKNPQKFEDYFQGYSPAQINAMSSSQFASHPELVKGMKGALADKEYQGVQLNLISDWVKREVQLGQSKGLSSEKELAVFVDIANQYGQSRADQAASFGKGEGDQSRAMNASIRGNNYPERFALIDKSFSAENVHLHKETPAPSDFGLKLASAVSSWDQKMAGTGNCAAAVQRALADVGLKEFLGSGNAWDMLGPLERSGHFVRVPESQATVGDLILRPPSQNPNDDSVYGDISVVTAKKNGSITQTNDASYEYLKANQRYDGKAVFLRYVGDSSSSNQVIAKNDSTNQNKGQTKKA